MQQPPNPESSLITSAPSRSRVKGKFIFVDDEKFYLRGVTYGTFRPLESGEEFPAPEVVDADFALMAENGINCVRTYTVPPTWLLDTAYQHGLRVLVGLPWEQHVTFIDEPSRMRSIEERVRAGVRACAGHPAILAYAIGNEIPAHIVRWHGRRPVERFLERLCKAVKSEDRKGLVTYVNYPTTEYLQLPFVDFICFNVYLESGEKFVSYISRLQNLAGDRPLVLAEIGLDSRRNGLEAQSQSLDWQVRSAFAGGCAGAFVFAWTDEWYRGGFDIEDWDFGLTDRERNPKPALAVVQKAFAEVPFPAAREWPRISVVVCSFNGARYIRGCLEGVAKLDYPNFEVIVVNDGSTDETESIALEFSERYGFRVISQMNLGLSGARNTGIENATGEIIAYIDDDAYPDPHWLTYLAETFTTTNHAGVGGPNIAPPGDGDIADCVANSPGGPIHVLVSDQEAEHIPGCNSAFRKACLEAIGGWDTQFRTAGDDVDVCWRLQAMGWTIGFNPAAVVWHHRRNFVRTYWKQQIGYGRAEALLERKWPEKYNAAGHLAWSGRLYGKGLALPLGFLKRKRIYQGVWGTAPYQSLHEQPSSPFWELPLMPEWHLITVLLAALTSLGMFWRPKLLLLPVLCVAAGVPLLQAILSAARASFPTPVSSRLTLAKKYAWTAALHLLQPVARLRGRLMHGLTPWRRRKAQRFSLPWRQSFSIWSESWHPTHEWLEELETALRASSVVVRGGNFDRWDLEVRAGTLGAARLLMTIEEHGGGRQLARFRFAPRWSPLRIGLILLLIILTVLTSLDSSWALVAIFGSIALLLSLRKLEERAMAMGTIQHGLNSLKGWAEMVSTEEAVAVGETESAEPVYGIAFNQQKEGKLAYPRLVQPNLRLAFNKAERQAHVEQPGREMHPEWKIRKAQA